MRSKIKSDGGGGANYYDLPIGATQLQDLIEYRNMNGNIKDIFKACYRMGLKDGTTDDYDMRKMVYYSLRELGRIDDRKDYLNLAEEIIGHQHEDGIDLERTPKLFEHDDVMDTFKYFTSPEEAIEENEDYENLLKDDEHQENIEKLHEDDAPRPIKVRVGVDGSIHVDCNGNPIEQVMDLMFNQS